MQPLQRHTFSMPTFLTFVNPWHVVSISYTLYDVNLCLYQMCSYSSMDEVQGDWHLQQKLPHSKNLHHFIFSWILYESMTSILLLYILFICIQVPRQIMNRYRVLTSYDCLLLRVFHVSPGPESIFFSCEDY